jgi:hypothetical protein
MARTWAQTPQSVITALILPRHKLIARAGDFEPLALYDLEADPGEKWNLRDIKPEHVREARLWLLDPNLEFFAVGEANVDPATRERLKVLGYAE